MGFKSLFNDYKDQYSSGRVMACWFAFWVPLAALVAFLNPTLALWSIGVIKYLLGASCSLYLISKSPEVFARVVEALS